MAGFGFAVVFVNPPRRCLQPFEPLLAQGLSHSRRRLGKPKLRVWARLGFLLGLSAFLFSWTAARFPGEWQEGHLPEWPVFPARDISGKSHNVALHDWVFTSQIDPITYRRWLACARTATYPRSPGRGWAAICASGRRSKSTFGGLADRAVEVGVSGLRSGTNAKVTGW
jgi:rhodanese-related sulfurtransferase